MSAAAVMACCSPLLMSGSHWVSCWLLSSVEAPLLPKLLCNAVLSNTADCVVTTTWLPLKLAAHLLPPGGQALAPHPHQPKAFAACSASLHGHALRQARWKLTVPSRLAWLRQRAAATSARKSSFEQWVLNRTQRDCPDRPGPFNAVPMLLGMLWAGGSKGRTPRNVPYRVY